MWILEGEGQGLAKCPYIRLLLKNGGQNIQNFPHGLGMTPNLDISLGNQAQIFTVLFLVYSYVCPSNLSLLHLDRIGVIHKRFRIQGVSKPNVVFRMS